MAVDRLRKKATDIIAEECQGRILREFPSQWLHRTLEEILEAAKQGDLTARKAAKLLGSGRFKK
jgi:phage gp29-like protein